VTLLRCYRATCDAPGCSASQFVSHDRTDASRRQLAALGWTTQEHHISAIGAARLIYACPAHRDWVPSDDGRRLVGMSMRDRRWLRIRRAAMLWMLHEREPAEQHVARGVTYAELAACSGLSAGRVVEIVQGYERVLEKRERSAADWQEPWAKRLRAAGAIR
jgi:hypothetical protein